MPVLESACPLDCPDLCSLTVEVQDDRVARVDGSSKNPLTAGFICGKVRKFPRHMYGRERLLHPMIRDGAKGKGAFRRVSWDAALDRVAHGLAAARDEHGGEAILPFSYGGCNGFLTHKSVDERLFRRLGASRLLRTFCAAPTSAAVKGLYGEMPGVALEDFAHARLIVLWGVNPSATGIHVVPIIREAKRRGAAVVVVDPRRIPLAADADLHLAVKPGADLPLALAVIHQLFETRTADRAFLADHTTGADELERRAAAWPLARAAEVTGVPEGDIARLARMYADASPAVIRCGWGQERNRNGGSATAAILSLPAVAGKFGVRGGGFTMSEGVRWRIDRDDAIAEPEQNTRAVNMNQLGAALRELSDPPITALFVYNANPVATAPAQEAVRAGLARDDLFTVVFEQVMTDTAAYADVLLPATTFLEHRELRRGYGVARMFDAPAVVAPHGEARPNYDVFADLCRRLGLERPGDPVGADALVDALIDGSPDRDALAPALAERGMAERPCGVTLVQFADAFPDTPDRKVHLVPEALDREAPLGLYGFQPDPATAAHPLALISPAVSSMVSSTFGQLHTGEAAVELHPDDAGPRGIRRGDVVRLFNDLGEVVCKVRISREVRPGVAALAKGLWRKSTRSGTTSNALVPDTLSDLAGGACYNDARVQIERVEAPAENPEATVR